MQDRNEEAIFDAAMELNDPAERARFVMQACGGDRKLLADVESLLRSHDSRSLLDVPVLDAGAIEDPGSLTEGPGTVIGRYKLLEKIGEGGMAVVYMAEQVEPIRRKVALKIIKLGMDTRQVIARFEAERQALALMDHPSIAKVLDAGATETGRPYFVMELVTGVSITEYCDKNNLSTKDRLALFVQVCNAVQHAHQKGIIHRDIKPSNVMVTHHDGKPVPKVIDFGIAKATNQRLTEKTLFTRYAHIIGTPAYMSPEQAELSDLDIDTRSDIYSLGVLLYELLTGTTPFSEEELRQAGYIEMQRIIREQQPAKPSTKLTTLGDTLTDIAKHRNSTPDLLRKAIRGDLDWIVMKSLEKDRARRYDTPNALASDILRHLEHEPVLARGPSTAYRLHKFLRRHRSQAIAALAFGVLIAIVVAVLSIWNRDRLQLAEAEGFRHRNILSQAREQYAKAERDTALETIKSILQSKHVGPEARLLQAGILVDNRRSDEAVTILGSLLNDRPEIAGAAHSLLARIIWESESLDAEKLKGVEEHRRQAEALLPETAEAYFLRAMTAVTIKEQLASLDKALQLDPSHYESHRLRAFTYYASRRYNQLHDDALVMTILRPRDSLGYSLRAAARRELGRYQEAIGDYDIALALTPTDGPAYGDLCTERSETLLQMGEYERVIAEVPVGARDVSPLRYHVFCALTALGEYDTATTLFRQIINPGHEARSQFQDWCMKYAFDTLEAGRSWHPAGREPAGPAFLPMVEAEETYRDLSAKGQRVATDGFTGNWSPDGTKLAFSLGFVGNSGVAVFDPTTKETDLLIVPGKDPRWSPDGRYIAFVRDCEVLRLPDLVEAAPEIQSRPMAKEEIWVIRPDGTEPRRLAYGGWPSWSRDSKRVYYQSRVDKMFCSISAEGAEAQPTAILPCANTFPAISPDGTRVAYLESASLKVKELASQKVVAQWPTPLTMWGGPAWSPTGNELCLGGAYLPNVGIGLWMYPVDGGEPAKVLSGQTVVAFWAWNKTKLLFALGPPYNEIWSAALDPKISTIEALGPGRTLDEHFHEMVAFYTHRIEADPQDAYAYSDRAHYYDCLRDRASANADMRQWSAIMGTGTACDARVAAPRDFRRVINMPFDCQLVFSAERPVNEIPVVNVAFGRKGKGNMKSLEIPLFVTSLIGFCLLSGLDAPLVQAGLTFGEPEKVPGLPYDEWIDCFSYDGLEMYVEAPGPTENEEGTFDLWVRKRASKDEDWGPPENLGPLVNSPYADYGASISSDGLTLYFISYDRSGGSGGSDIYATTRATKNDPWGPAVNLGPTINSSAGDQTVWISADSLELYFGSNRSGGFGVYDIYVAKRVTANDPWGAPANLGPVVNTPYGECFVSLSPDGLLLFFSEWRESTTNVRPGGHGAPDLWMTRRVSLSDPWQTPVNLGSPINGPTRDFAPRISPDGHTLYFRSMDRSAGWDNWQARIIPIVDFNGDGRVDNEDVTILRAPWGQDYPLCDIGPFPWGDGIVDVRDLSVLMETMNGTRLDFSPTLHALEVPRDIVLSWTSPEFARTHDVYFGTSFEDVNSAGRGNPLDALVSQGQTATTYNLQGLLSFSRTYFWRIDEVSPAPVFTIYRGPILDFTTEAYAYPIAKVIATASSSQPGWGPEKTIDRSGLDKNDGHSTTNKHMWLSGMGGEQPAWIQYQFDAVYTLHEMWVWNHNLSAEPSLGFGLKNVSVQYSINGTDWTTLADMEFAQATGQEGYAHNTTVSFNGVPAKYVRLIAKSNWSGAKSPCGLSEVRFFYVPVYPSQPTPISGQKRVDVDVSLSWRAGREAASHLVHLSTDKEAVAAGNALVATVHEASLDPGPLNLGWTYYWKVNEVNEAQTPSVREGDLWSFSTREYLVVDDFESYTNDSPNRVFQTWIDGAGFSADDAFPKGNPGNGTGSAVGYDPTMGNIMETASVHGGRQSMPIEYDNINSPFYSETQRTFDPPQDWTVHGADTLVLWFRGNPIDFLQRADGGIQVSGGGADIWGTSDQFRFAYKQLTGDGSVVARVHSLTATNPWAKAGVMIRESLDTASAYAFMTPTSECRRAFQNRPVTGASAVSADSAPGTITFPIWVKVERQGSYFTGYYSQDGKNWIKQPESDDNTRTDRSTNPQGITMSQGVYIGLAVTSHNVSAVNVAEFSDVSFAGTVTGQWQVEAIGVEQPSNDVAPLYIALEDNAGHVKTIAHADPDAVQAASWQTWMIPFHDLQGLNLAAVKKMYIGVGDRANPTAGGSGVIYLDDIGFGHPLASK